MSRFLFIAVLIGAFFFGLFSQYIPKVYAAADPIAYWKFDDGSGTSPDDSGASNITASFLTPNPSWSTDVPSAITFDDPYSLDFTGSGDGVSISWPAGLNFAATDPRSFSFWYKPTANGEAGGTMARIISWSSDQFEIAGTDGSNSTHRIAYYDGNWHSTDINLSLGTWYHVTFTYDGTTAKFYIGEELQDEHALAGRALSGTMMIGNRVQNPNEGINGLIDDVRVYNYALNSTQVGNLASGKNNPDGDPTPTPTPTPNNNTNPQQSFVYQHPSTTEAPTCNDFSPTKAPKIFQVDAAGTYANLYFETVIDGTTGYRIEYGTNREANQHSDTFNHKDQNWTLGRTINYLHPNTEYYFKVQAVNGCTAGPWSGIKSIKTRGQLANITNWFANLSPFNKKPAQLSLAPSLVKSNVAGVKTSASEDTSQCEHIFKAGESLWGIARWKLGSVHKLDELLAMNPGIDPNKMYHGQKIKVCG